MQSLIRYQTKPECAEVNKRLVENVYRELAETDPGGVRYATLCLEDGVTFVHIFVTDTDGAPNPLSASAAFAEFQRDLAARCVKPPLAQGITVVGSYRFPAE